MPPKRKGKKRTRQEPQQVPEDLLDPNQKDEIIMTFQNALKTGECTLSLSKAKKCFKNLGLEAKSEDIQTFLGNDTNCGEETTIETIDEASFVRFAASKRLQAEKAFQAFELMDQDGKGVVVVEDLERVAQDLGEEMTREELEELIEVADRSGDGLLTSQDFVRLARKVNL